MFLKNTKIPALILVLAMVISLAACGGKTPAETTAPTAAPTVQTAPAETTEPVQTIAPATEDYVVVTPYGNLLFPGDWSPFLKVEHKDGRYTFFAVLESREDLQPLFTISFGGDGKDAAGAVKDAYGKYIAVHAEKAEFKPDASWTESDSNIVFNMQRGMDYILMNFVMADADVLIPEETTPTQPGSKETTPTQPDGEDPAPTEPEETINPEDLALDTPYLELHYPAKWAENLSIEITEGEAYGVSYSGIVGSHEAQPLFTIWFGGSRGITLKTIKTADGASVEIRVEVTEVLLDGSWSEAEKNTLLAMQEDLNYLLARLD